MSKIPMYKHEVLSLYNKVSLNIDPIDEIILARVVTDRFGVPIGIDSARRATEVVEHLINIVNEYDFDKFVLHFDLSYNLADGTVSVIPGGYQFDVLSYKDQDDIMVDGGITDDVSDCI